MALNKNKDLKMFWEKEFPNIKPQKAGRGIRQYTKADLEQVRLVYHLVKERGMTLQGARDAIRRDKSKTVNRNIEVIEKLKDIRSQLQAISRDMNGLV